MDKIKVIYSIELENGSVRDFTVNDVAFSASDAEIVAVGDELITRECEYKGSLFKRLVKTKKVSSTEEIL